MDKYKGTYESDLLTLVKMIEERPCIWDKSCIKGAGEKKRAWREICQHFAPFDLEVMEEEEVKKLARYLNGKWQNVRDTFIRMAKKNTVQKYRYYENMKFLMKNIDVDQEISPQEQQQSTEKVENSPANRILKSSPTLSITFNHKRKRRSSGLGLVKRTNLELDEVEPESSSSTETANNAKSPPEPRETVVNNAKPPPEPNETAVNNAKPRPEPRQGNKTLDEDEAFFLSVMPMVRRFASEDKIEFRMGVLGVIRQLNQRSKLRNSLPEGSGVLFITDNEFNAANS